MQILCRFCADKVFHDGIGTVKSKMALHVIFNHPLTSHSLYYISLITSADFHYHKFGFSFARIEKSYLVFDFGRLRMGIPRDGRHCVEQTPGGGELSSLWHGRSG